MSLLERTRAVLPSWLAIYYDDPIEIERGEGRRVWDTQGNAYLDFFGGILTTMTAHALPEVTKAVSEQAGRIIHSSTLYLNRPMVELAEQIATVSAIPDAKVFFTTSGTEANDAALLLASSLRRSNQILALRNSYHGRSFSTIAITGNRSWSPTSLSPFQTYYVHGGQQYRSPFAGLSDGEYIAACVADLKEVLDQAGGDIAAFIAEPIQGVGGFTSGPDGLLGAFAEVLREKGILWISDEVQTGWGRTGEHFWGWEAHRGDDPNLTPDLVTFAKGVGNGLSMGGVIAPASTMDSLGANSISTFGGSPLTAAGALANLRYLLDHRLQENAALRGPALLDGLRAIDNPHVGDVRGKGLMIGVELVRPSGDGPGDPAPDIANAVLEATKRHGVLIGKGGLSGNVLRIAPPLSLTQAEAEEGLAALVASIEEVTP
jgi:4-aminobutyrate aminotransferase